MKTRILRLSIFAALFLCITSLITAASAIKCPYCGDEGRALICPNCGLEVTEHHHVSAPGVNEKGEGVFFVLVQAECPNCGYEWLEEVM